jgi:hypothetical protein
MVTGRDELLKISNRTEAHAKLDTRVDAPYGTGYTPGIIEGAVGGKVRVRHLRSINGRTKFGEYDPYSLRYYIGNEIIIFFEDEVQHIYFVNLDYEIAIPPDSNKNALALLLKPPNKKMHKMCDNPCENCKIKLYCDMTDGKIPYYALLRYAKCEFGNFYKT